MVDSVMIDSNYDGKVFNITLADVPEKKNDAVDGKYVVEAKKGRDGCGQGDGYVGRGSAGGETGVEGMRRWPIKNR
jgi:hypothetical protein